MTQKILFDVDGVLIHGYTARAQYRRCWDETLETDFGISRAEFTARFIRGPFTTEVLVGTKSLQDALTETLPMMGHDIPAQDLVDYWLEKDSCVNHDLMDKVAALKSTGRVRLFVATNQEHNRASYLMTQLGFDRFFEDIFHSARIGATKPDAAYFKSVSELLGLRPNEQPIFFDDCPKVVAAAKEHGWQAHEFITVDDIFKNDLVGDLLAA